MNLPTVIVKGAGDLATGIILKLKKSHFRVIAIEIEKPTTIRRTVSLSESVYQKEVTVENIKGVYCGVYKNEKGFNDELIRLSSLHNTVPIICDENWNSIKALKPDVVVDAIIAKKNLGTTITDAPLVIALGPGFNASIDCHYVIETARGHYCGSIIEEGMPEENTGIPGVIAGFSQERVIHSLNCGVFKATKNIGDLVKKGEIIGYVDSTSVHSKIDGLLRGVLKSGLYVPKNFKIADVDPRGKKEYIYTHSDKARLIAGGVLECIMRCFNKD